VTHVIQTESRRPSKVREIALWPLQVLTAAAFLMAGFGKLSGQPMMVQTFEKICAPGPSEVPGEEVVGGGRTEEDSSWVMR